MKWGRVLGPSLRNLLAYRLRSALAAAGVAIGIAAVSWTSALGQGAEAAILASVGSMGARLLIVRPARVERSAARRALTGFVSSLKLEDSVELERLPHLEVVAPSVEGKVQVRAAAGAIATEVLGTTPSFFRARGFEVERGRAFEDSEDRELARLAVLGGRAAKTLFPAQDPIGQELRIGRTTFEVVGALRPKGATGDGADADNQVFIPVRTALRRVYNARSLTRVFVRVREPNDLEPVKTDVRALLRERHRREALGRPDDFDLQDPLRTLAAERKTARLLRGFTSGLAAVSLLIGGTGILSLMLLSVRERTPEIGLRMALGARPRDILVQFLTEAVALAFAGGLGGAGLGAAGTTVLREVTGWPVHPSTVDILVCLGTAVWLGLTFGVLPARRAAMLAPLRALGLE